MNSDMYAFQPHILMKFNGNFSVLSVGVDSVLRTDEFLDHCGSNYCPLFAENLTAIDAATFAEQNIQRDQNKQNITTISIIFLICALLSALIVAIFVDPLSR